MHQVYVHQYGDLSQMPMLPLAAGLITASAKLDPDVAGTCNFELVTEREPVDYQQPWVLAFSVYTWNLRISLQVAIAAKRRFPEALVVLGGPSVPREPSRARAFMDLHPEIDVLVFGEGEITFRELLVTWRQTRNLEELAGTAVRSESRIVFGPERQRVRNFEQTASPYLDGTFDIWRANRPWVTGALLETNRGCPFRCTFCDWGQATASRVNEIPMARVKAELNWIATNGFPYVYIIDANFGIRRRDPETVAHLARLKIQHGMPYFCYFHLTKNVETRNLITVETLLEAGIGCHVAISMQSYEPLVLQAIERDNISQQSYHRVQQACTERGIPTSNELLLGLPEQTYDGFVQGLVQTLSPWPQDSFFLYPVRLLENAAMASDQHRIRFDLQTRMTKMVLASSQLEPSVLETEEVVVGSNTMTVNEWGRAFTMGSLLNALYNLELAGLIIAFLRFSSDIDLRSWLEALLDEIRGAEAGTVFAEIRDDMDRMVEGILSNNGTLRLHVADIPDRNWELHEMIAIRALRRYDDFCAALKGITASWQLDTLDPAIVDELFVIQRFVVPTWSRRSPGILTTAFDWPTWQPALARGEFALPARCEDLLSYHPPAHLQSASRADLFLTDHLTQIYAKQWRPTLTRAET